MEMRQLGKDGPEVSRICFGCFSMGGAGVWGWADINDEDSIAAVHKALDAGITFFDNAALYGLGHAEELLGKALGNRRKDVLVATKCGYWRETMWEPKSYRDSSPANIRREIYFRFIGRTRRSPSMNRCGSCLILSMRGRPGM